MVMALGFRDGKADRDNVEERRLGERHVLVPVIIRDRRTEVRIAPSDTGRPEISGASVRPSALVWTRTKSRGSFLADYLRVSPIHMPLAGRPAWGLFRTCVESRPVQPEIGILDFLVETERGDPAIRN